ncbi:MAG: choice-of-anchor B family protein, partial [Ignavibacteria bacterium]|nr:choice-of-anchor B family protein [Ignavibacteria bacterium]
MKTLLLILLFVFSNSNAQLPNYNTYLLANINNYPGYSGCWGYVTNDNKEYALLGCFNGTSFVNITDSSNIHEVDFVPGANSAWREIKTYSHYAYVVSEGTNSKLQIIDLQYLPDSVSLIKTWNYSGYTQAHNISQSGPYLYLSGGNASPNGGVQIIDVSDPVNPVRRGFNSVRYAHDCTVKNDTIWSMNINNQRLSILNANNKDSIFEIRNFTTLQSSPHNCAFTKDNKFVYISYENTDPGMIDIWNIEDIDNITYIRSWQPTGITTSITHNVEIYDTIAIVAHYTAGIRIINISDPLNPQEIAWYDTRPQDNSTNYFGCWSVY